MTVPFRTFDPATDTPSVHRIWLETGWIEDSENDRAAMDIFMKSGRSNVAVINGDAECLVLTMPGTIRYLSEDIPFGCVTSVTTSRVARKQGLAGRLTALSVAQDAADGAAVAGLGMFEQGYYNRLGFGSGGWETRVTFDPATLNVPPARRVPVRLTVDDFEKTHVARLTRRRGHGACNLTPPEFTHAETKWSKNGFGLGFADGPDGELTHQFWTAVRGDVEFGPYSVFWITYQTMEQFLELLGVIRNLGDQVNAFRMRVPAGILFQDLLTEPFKRMRITGKTDYHSRADSYAFWQMRICDLDACLQRTNLRSGPVRFNLKMADPIENHLDDDAPWRGVAGEYVVTLGPSSGAERGRDQDLPTLEAPVGPFTRLWLGVASASSLAVTDDLAAPPELLEQLDDVLRLPPPHPDWDF